MYISRDLTQSVDELSVKIQAASSSSSGTESRIQDLVERIENIQEKMYDFEVNKRNNLLFYGVKEDRRETPNDLFSKVTDSLIDLEFKLSPTDKIRVAGLLLPEERHHDQLGLQDVLRARCGRLQVATNSSPLHQVSCADQ